ncbi:MAG: universal stress protein [Alphaproteobacteria bacterium]|nr:universal stress protein [Alphaproteobacteria bacterium]
MRGLKRILVPVDGSEASLRAAHFAATLSAAASAELHVLHVLQLDALEEVGLDGLSEESRRERIDVLCDPIFRQLASELGRWTDPIPLNTRGVVGDPVVEILAATTTLQPELLVMGYRGLSPLQGIVVGSVSERVLRRARCPVTLVR